MKHRDQIQGGLPLLLFVALLVLMAASCHRWYRIEVTDPTEALVLLEDGEIPVIEDDLDLDSLAEAIHQSMSYLERLAVDRKFQYGPYSASVEEVKNTLVAFTDLLNAAREDGKFPSRFREDFLWFRAAGRDIFGGVLFTGYYEPLLEGRLKPDSTFRFPLYRRPSDLLDIDLGAFRENLRGQRLAGRIDGTSVVPYYSREDIDAQEALAGRGLEIAWVKDPVALFFLHVQGSGQVMLEDGRRIHVNYAGTNGHHYRSIGKILIDEGAIPKDKMSMQAIQAYLLENPSRLQEILFANPSYIFFDVADAGPKGSLAVPLTPGRSIATDSRLFPSGGLAFIQSEQPVVGKNGQIEGWKKFCRFVLNQDTGGAIRGAGRVDLFCGSGPYAELMAGHLNHEGRLFFLLKRSRR